ncbi:MAG: type II secretion system major pseudopilin GspG [Phycisphaeraceae bacterium]|nr:type II secretion system major pseudopilin GspG [Phycisphaeraceae bacterium]
MEGSTRLVVRRVIRRAPRGFTLLEVMIVIVIILAIAGLVTVNLMGTKQEATKGTVQIQLKSFKDALKQFNLTFNRFPTDEEGLVVLWDKSALSEEDQGSWRPYLDEATPKDPWGSEWGYKAVGEKGPEGMFDLWSYGPDKQDGTEDDISVWKATEGSDSGSGSSGPVRPTPRSTGQ